LINFYPKIGDYNNDDALEFLEKTLRIIYEAIKLGFTENTKPLEVFSRTEFGITSRMQLTINGKFLEYRNQPYYIEHDFAKLVMNIREPIYSDYSKNPVIELKVDSKIHLNQVLFDKEEYKHLTKENANKLGDDIQYHIVEYIKVHSKHKKFQTLNESLNYLDEITKPICENWDMILKLYPAETHLH